jgi:hypothetical protein
MRGGKRSGGEVEWGMASKSAPAISENAKTEPKVRARRSPARRPEPHPFAIPGWKEADLKGFYRSALAEETEKSMVALGFKKISSCESYHSQFSMRDGKLDEFSLWIHPQGIVADMSTTTGGFRSERDSSVERYASEDYDPHMRKVNSVNWSFQLMLGCGEAAIHGVGKMGGSGGAAVGDDGTWFDRRQCSMISDASRVIEGIQSAGMLVPIKNWSQSEGAALLHMSSQLWQGRQCRFGDEPSSDPAWLEQQALLKKEWLATLPGELADLIAASNLNRDAKRQRINDVGVYLARCVGAAGRRWTTQAEKRLHGVWSQWVGDADGVEAIPQDDADAFKISDCGAHILQCLLIDCQNERSLRLALDYIQAAPIALLSKLANTPDARGVSAGMRCVELCSVLSLDAAPLAQIFEALAGRLGPKLRMSTAQASAIGLVFSEADRPHRRARMALRAADALGDILCSAERHGVDWSSGGLRCPCPAAPKHEPLAKDKRGRKKAAEQEAQAAPWIEANREKAVSIFAKKMGEWGAMAAQAIAEAKELRLSARMRKPTAKKKVFAL